MYIYVLPSSTEEISGIPMIKDTDKRDLRIDVINVILELRGGGEIK